MTDALNEIFDIGNKDKRIIRCFVQLFEFTFQYRANLSVFFICFVQSSHRLFLLVTCHLLTSFPLIY